jgi:hypothetical protein
MKEFYNKFPFIFTHKHTHKLSEEKQRVHRHLHTHAKNNISTSIIMLTYHKHTQKTLTDGYDFSNAHFCNAENSTYTHKMIFKCSHYITRVKKSEYTIDQEKYKREEEDDEIIK